MSLDLVLHSLVSVLPVCGFLLMLVYLDSFKLVPLRAVLVAVLAGGIAALVCYGINVTLLGTGVWEGATYSRYVAPLVEEGAKALYVIYLIRKARVGFVVDAAVYGFAVGAGFAVVENIYYLNTALMTTVWTWVVRGFGTAIMHGGTVALFAMISKQFQDRRPDARGWTLLPGFAAAYLLHALFNHFLLPPMLSMAVLLLVFSLLITVVFHQSEQATRQWLGVGFDTDQELLASITSGTIVDSPVGQYLDTLKAHFPGTVIVDMLCLLHLHVELSIRAKGLLMMQEAGFRVPPDPDVAARFEEIAYLETSIGPTGMRAIEPFLHTTTRDLWQRNMLEGAGAKKKRKPVAGRS